MADYTYESGASFPKNGVMELTNYLDATDSISVIIAQIKEAQNAGDYEKIKALMQTYDLKRYILTAEAINKIEEETRNTEIYATAKRQQIYYQNEFPTEIEDGDIWISD